jgi:hypothetical protein
MDHGSVLTTRVTASAYEDEYYVNCGPGATLFFTWKITTRNETTNEIACILSLKVSYHYIVYTWSRILLDITAPA